MSLMPGDQTPTLNPHLRKSDARSILRQIRRLERQRDHERKNLLRYETQKEHLGLDIYDGIILHIKDDIAHMDERIRAFEATLEEAHKEKP